MEVGGQRRRGGRILRWALGLMAGLPAAGAALEMAARAMEEARHPPPGRMVRVRGRALHLLCKGAGDPAVVLVTGVGGSCLQWSRVQEALEQRNRVCAYDRAGLGWSQPAAGPRTADVLADELAELLDAAGIEGAVVLVGQSFGGQVALQLAVRRPERVAGILLVDAIGPGSFPPMDEASVQEESKRLLRSGARLAWLARLGTLRMVGWFKGREGGGTAADAAEAGLRIRPERIETLFRERAALRDSVAIAPARLPDSLPLTVISSYRDLPAGDARREAQERLARLSAESRHVITYKSGHNIHLEEPELVVREVEALIRRARAKAHSEEQHDA